ncbi:MAG: hypothetical protein R3F34_17280 [Planctomycetota bacterium]
MLHLLPALALVPALAAPRQGALDLVPEDAFVVLHVDSVAGLHDALAKSAYWQFFAGERGVLRESGMLADLQDGAPFDLESALALFGSTELDEAERDALPAEAVLGFEFVRGFRGSLTVFAAGSPSRPTFGLVMEPGGPVDEFTQRLESLFDRPPIWRERSGVMVATETDGDLAAQRAYVVKGADYVLFLGASDAATAFGELDRATGLLLGGEGPSIDDNPRWVEAAAATAGVGQCRFFLDLETIVGALPTDEFAASDFDARALLSDLGVSRMRWLGARMHVGDGETASFDVEVGLPDDCVLAKVVGLGAGGVPLRFLSRFDEGCASATAARFDVSRFFDLAVDVAGRYAPAEVDAFEQQLAQLPAMLGFDPIDGLVRQLTGEFAVCRMPLDPSTNGEPDAAALMGGDTTFVCGVRDGRKFDDSLWGLLRFFENSTDQSLPIERESVAGQDLARLELPVGNLYFGVGNDAFALGFDAKRTARALALTSGGRRSPMDDQAFARAFEQSANALVVQVTRTGPATASAFAGFRTLGTLPVAGGASNSPFASSLARLADFSERARTAFTGVASSVIERTPRGVRFHVGAR